MSRLSAPGAVRWIARKLEEAGFETWAVGGAVRDVLAGVGSGDWDLTTRARPEQVRRVFRRTVPIGIEHGTVGVLADDGIMYEVTTFRRDVETDGRRAVVAFAETLEEDLARRDFTINAVAWHPIRGEVRDPFGGIADLEGGVLRSVGEADHRFAEDYLRILRAMRFAGRFELRVDPGTWGALVAAVHELHRLSPERIREELLKVLDMDRRPSVALGLYRESGALRELYPELEALTDERWLDTLRIVDRLRRGRPFMRLAALLRPIPEEGAAAVLLRLRLSNAQVDETARRAHAPRLPNAEAPDSAVRAWLADVGPGRLTAVAKLELDRTRVRGEAPEEVVEAWRRARAILTLRPPLTVGDLTVDGRDLISLGLKPGPRFGQILERLLDWVIDEPARNDRDRLLARAEELAAALAGEPAPQPPGGDRGG